MQPWTVTFLLALAGTAIAMPAVEPAVEPAVDVADTHGSIVARGFTDCCTWGAGCFCLDSGGTRRAMDWTTYCTGAPTCERSKVPPQLRGSSS
ncbi:hypothetical protein HOO65_050404 [Ceratocystis lukuohia]|uniref:Uncharacterized protein n=1 Tax=Ceratocystis lukuohia TaxID=2019550 RepID=A0ABR4MG56_9PEZI